MMSTSSASTVMSTSSAGTGGVRATPMRLFTWEGDASPSISSATDRPSLAFPQQQQQQQSAALAAAFRRRSQERWATARALRADPVLPELERLAQQAAERRHGVDADSARAAAEFATAELPFRLRSRHSWQQQREALRAQQVEAAPPTSPRTVNESLALKLQRQGYALGGVATNATGKTGGVASPPGASSSFRDASRDAWTAAKALRSELPDDVSTGAGASAKCGSLTCRYGS